MTRRDGPRIASAADAVGVAISSLLDQSDDLDASAVKTMVDVAGRAVGARSARLLVADYGLTSLQEVGELGPCGVPQMIEGTLAGRCFATREVVVSGQHPATVWVPLAERSERFGVLQLEHASWSDDLRPVLDRVVQVLVLLLISTRRYTDVVLRSRRSQPLSVAGEIQWALLPPLTYSTAQMSVSGILEPAYSIGGDAFDYAVNPGIAEFAIIDAVGHGIDAVSISVLALNSLRNARRERRDLADAYLEAGAMIDSQFGHSAFATGQIGTLALDTGELTWLNAGHPLPLLVRDRSFIRELACPPSLPMGLRGRVNAIARERLQPGDRVLFYTDGVVESRGRADEEFGVGRLGDLLVRASTEGSSPSESVRRLAAAVLDHNGRALRDDATLLLLEYHGSDATPLRSGAPRS